MNGLSEQPYNQDHVLALCHMLSNRLGKAFAPLLEEYHITIHEWRVITTIAKFGAISGREITDRWAMDKMAINRAITRLVKRGFIDQRQNNMDRRTKNLFLTTAGNAIYETLLPAAIDRFQTLMECLDDTEQKHFRTILTKMITRADVISK